MIKDNIQVFGDYNRHGQYVIAIEKKRGKIAIQEIEEVMREKDITHCAILLTVREDEYQGWDSINTKQPDRVELHEIIDDEKCPICGQIKERKEEEIC